MALTCHFFIKFLVDIDECMTNNHNCHEDATCSNTKGLWDCFCNKGYEGNGTNCQGNKNFFQYEQDKSTNLLYKIFPGKNYSSDVQFHGYKMTKYPKGLGFRIRIVFTSFPSQNLLSTRHQRMHKKSAWLPSRCYLQQHRGVLGMLL